MMMALNIERAAKDMAGASTSCAHTTRSRRAALAWSACMVAALRCGLTLRPDGVVAVVPYYGIIPGRRAA
jgi:hypothetical protein